MEWAFMTANYVAKEVGYKDVTDWFKDWGRCTEATIRSFHRSQFELKFESLISGIKENGFDAIELWVGHLHPETATDEMVRKARGLLDKYELSVVSYTASFSSPNMTVEEGARRFEIARAIGAPLLASSFNVSNAELIVELSQRYGIFFGLENHPERNAQEIIEKISPYSPWIGAALDTGWFGTNSCDVSAAVGELAPYLKHVHLKDVLAAGAHDSCGLGEGVVDIKGALRELHAIGYQGALTLEHEPYDHDPMPAMVRSLQLVKQQWNELQAQEEKQ
ncbi:sugar phosphate isomerase/epimerase family protein [Paenibacillus sp. B01]|uniref:sugar phosphate isomerase/epimerase family protein n=1 Tax=Paenibacillus sp. B01 TaxID=2660554 RepID=UPI00129B5888|nr:sugar phosphate isomerase/epimerase family protein [Paenibacillus sp. B01]QGG55917.1 TIM barrel protein [Paenibacillus sp. B01]